MNTCSVQTCVGVCNDLNCYITWLALRRSGGGGRERQFRGHPKSRRSQTCYKLDPARSGPTDLVANDRSADYNITTY
ncbi:hypothetical protein J6590_052709 [Homalodisca vitripennis]|nr:hypothetical protein J6590_052709 [Homalodisca vitripennis]